MIFWITYLRFKLLHQLEPKRHFKIALRPSNIPAKVSNFRNSSVSGKERARERKVIGHDFRKRKLLTQLCHLAQSVFAILSASSLAKHPCDL